MKGINLCRHTLVTPQNLKAINQLLNKDQGIILHAAVELSAKPDKPLTGVGMMRLLFNPYFNEQGELEDMGEGPGEPDREYRLFPRFRPSGAFSWDTPEPYREQLLIEDGYIFEIHPHSFGIKFIGKRDFLFLFIPNLCSTEQSLEFGLNWITSRLKRGTDFIFKPRHIAQMVEYAELDLERNCMHLNR